MSNFSGKCDLFDHLMSYKRRTKDGSDKKEDLEKARVLYSDEMECFQIFMQKTKGVIHQMKYVHVDVFNQDFIAEKCSQFKIIEHIEKVEDKRMALGFREKKYYTYEYWGKEYSLKEINKKGVHITVDIKIDTLLDLIPYYPYIVASSCSAGGEEVIYISNRSFVEEEYEKHLQHGWESSMAASYRKELQNHYREVVLRYFNPEGRKIVENLHFGEDRLAHTKFRIDKNFEVEWYFLGKKKPHWTSPKIVGDYTIEISKEDYEDFLGHDVKVSYVEYKELPLYLG